MLEVIIYTSNGETQNCTSKSVNAPGLQGEFQVLPGHTEMYALLGEGEVVCNREEDDDLRVSIINGEIHVRDNTVTIIAVTQQ